MLKKYVVGALALALVAVIPATASAAVTSQSITASVKPAKLSKSKKTATPVALTVATNTGYSGFTPAATAADIDFPKQLKFNTTKVPTCNAASIANTTTAQAIAACGSSMVGSGSATLNGVVGPQTAVVTAFNGAPVGGQPQILLHTRVGGTLQVTQVLTGTLQTSPLGGAYGKRLHVVVPLIAGGAEVITHFDTTVTKAFKVKGKKSGYVTATCPKPKAKLPVSSVFTFVGGSTQPATTQIACKGKK